MESPLKKKQLLEFEFEFSDAQPVPNNPEFSYGKAKILYTKKNRNQSYLTDDSVKKALPTVFGIPIVGEYNENTDNYGGHGGKIEISDKGIEFIDTTVPYGYVSENSKVYWETVEELDGTIRDYFVADRCVFWTGRYPQLNTLLENGKFNQSMEIGVNNGEFAIIDGEEVFRIDDFTFSALCILGISKEDDPDGHVEPCFENASIEIYNQEQSNFQAKFTNMIAAYNQSDQEGGQPVADKKETEVKEEFEQETPVVDETPATDVPAEDKEEEVETPAKEEEVDTKEEEEEIPAKEEEVQDAPDETPAEEFTVTATQYAEVQNELAIAKSANTLMAGKLATANEEFAALEAEAKELRAFKRQTELDEVAEKFSGKLEEDILKSTIESNSEKSVEELESLIFAEIGKQNFSQNKESSKKEPKAAVAIPANEKPKAVGRYAHLREKHLN